MSADKYPSIFSRQKEATVYLYSSWIFTEFLTNALIIKIDYSDFFLLE